MKNLIDGSGKIVLPNMTSIKAALGGDTSLVQTEDEGLILNYNKDDREIHLFLFDELIAMYFPLEGEDMETQKAVAKFLSLYFEHYGTKKLS